MTQTSQTRPKFRPLTGTALKWLACLSMLVDHFGASCLEAGLLLNPTRLAASGLNPDQVYALDLALRMFGRLAFPIYCFLLVEGFLHTHSVYNYGKRLFFFALISEIPFDWAFYRTPFYWAHQNVYWTLFLGVPGMEFLRRYGPEGPAPSHWKGLAGAAFCLLAAGLFQTDYSMTGVTLILVLYAMRQSRLAQCVTGAAMMAYELTGPLAFVPVWFYNGQRGRCPAWLSRVFYLFYPVHILILGCVTNLLLG